MQNNRRRTRGQATVEFALAAILIFFLLSAAIDLGLIFFRHQGLYNASLEGAQFGSRYTKTFTGAELLAKYDDEGLQRIGCYVPNMKASGQYVCIDEAAIRDRLVNEAGDSGGIGLVNMKDLDSNGEPDDDNLRNDYIDVYAVNTENVSDPTAQEVACPSIANPTGATCYIYVRVKSDYNMFFVLAPAFGSKVDISAYTIFPVRTGLFQPGVPTGTVVIANVPPTATVTSSATRSPTLTSSPTTVPPTNTNGPTATKTPVPVVPSATATNIPGTSTRTPTPVPPSATATPTGPTRTRTPSLTPVPSNTQTQTLTPSKTLTPSRTFTASTTPTPSRTFTPSATRTRTLTRTPTLSPSRTVSPTPSNTNTQTLTPSKTNTPPPPTNTVPPTVTRTPTVPPTPTKTSVPPTLTKTSPPPSPTTTATTEGT